MTSDNHLSPEAITLDQLFDIVSSGTRRWILEAVREESPRGIEEVTGFDRLRDRDPESIRAALYHNHLPRLNEVGLIQWHRERATIARGPRFGEIRPFLKLMDEHQDALPASWP